MIERRRCYKFPKQGFTLCNRNIMVLRFHSLLFVTHIHSSHSLHYVYNIILIITSFYARMTFIYIYIFYIMYILKPHQRVLHECNHAVFAMSCSVACQDFSSVYIQQAITIKIGSTLPNAIVMRNPPAVHHFELHFIVAMQNILGYRLSIVQTNAQTSWGIA